MGSNAFEMCSKYVEEHPFWKSTMLTRVAMGFNYEPYSKEEIRRELEGSPEIGEVFKTLSPEDQEAIISVSLNVSGSEASARLRRDFEDRQKIDDDHYHWLR